nr:putative capsid protein [Crucivirus sp.]
MTKAVGAAVLGNVPGMRSTATGCIIRHKEYIGDVQPTVLFTNAVYPLNPGSDDTFPWLSQIAGAFQQYRWRGLVFSYKSTSADLVSTTNTSLGSVIMATDYSAVEPEIKTKREMLNYEHSTTSKPSGSFLHIVDTQKKQTFDRGLLYTRIGDIPANADRRLYDIGTFYISTEGMQSTAAGAQIGELWVSYEIEFLKPKFNLSTGVESQIWYIDGSALVGSTYVQFFGASMVDSLYYKTYGNVGAQLADSLLASGVSTITFPRSSEGKTYLVQYHAQGNAGTGTSPSITYSFPAAVAGQTIMDFARQENSLPTGIVASDTGFIPNQIATNHGYYGGVTPATAATSITTSLYVTVGKFFEQSPPVITMTPSNAAKAVWPQPLGDNTDVIILIITEIQQSTWQEAAAAVAVF